MSDEENKCCLCGRKESQDTRTDFLRECYEKGQDGKWDKGLMQPRLNFIELGYIKRGFNHVCHNRTNCRKRQPNRKKNEQRNIK